MLRNGEHPAGVGLLGPGVEQNELVNGDGRFSSDDEPSHFIEHLRVTAMSVGTYSIPAGSHDDQAAHAEDEVYVVLAGRARFTAGSETLKVEPGTTMFVPAGEDHRFHDVEEDLATLVVFGPAYTGRP